MMSHQTTVQNDEVEHIQKRERGRPKKGSLPLARSRETPLTRKSPRKKKKNLTPHKHRRFTRGTFPPYNEAKKLVRALCNAQSRKQYYDWHQKNNIMYIPFDPQKCYKDEWESWNVWLNTNNFFNKPSTPRFDGSEDIILPFFEAARWAHTLDLNLIRDWKQYIKEGGYVPYGVPRRPDYWYTKYGAWYGWPTFLGKGPKNNNFRIEVHNKFVEHHRRVFLLWDKKQHKNDTFIITYGGSLEHAKFTSQVNINILAAYKCNRSDQTNIVKPLIDYYSFPIDEKNKHVRTTDKWVDLKWQLDNSLYVIQNVYSAENNN